MDASRLETIGQALFGVSWKTDLADALEVRVDTVRNWLRGRSRIPPTLDAELAEICQTKGEELTRLAGELRAS